ncbi:MAG: Phage integrase:Phage integrase N-terminal SAM-like [Planctomycetota bacterium]|nr:MAG: Phage integrase:Phage integrase N-terminal SAM-like [Planctomycetota bacterium]
MTTRTTPSKVLAVKGEPVVPDNLSTHERVGAFLSRLLPATNGHDAAAALVPWVCDRLPSPHSRRAYAGDLARFVAHMRGMGVDPFRVTGDHVRIYKEALQQAKAAPSTIGRMLSVIRGTYRQFAAKGLVDHDTAADIQAVGAPRVTKNTTPALSEIEAKRLLHAPDTTTVVGVRDFAMLFTFFVTACRVSAIAKANVGDLERTDTNWYLVVTEKGNKRQRKSLLQSANSLLRFLECAGINGDPEGPLFRPLAKDRRTFLRRHMTQRAMLCLVKKYCRQVGIDPDRVGRRGIGVHSLRKTALTNALEHGARMEQVQQLAGHSDIRTTQMYYQNKETDAEDAARHIQIR